VSLVVPNLSQDFEHKQEETDDVRENEELTSSCSNSEPSLSNAPITPAATENAGNAHGATLTEGESCLDVLNFSTNHAVIEELLV
ncbi:hypothetical protein, partial [Pseudomonas rhodesiae]|uniref:hypothetical protein n=1 Tax=Pseudomonas rhodesiae TaxID=76760 RepID=UPI002B1CEE85